MRYIAFVTSELYPLTAGGIGRVLYNMLITMAESDRKRTVVILVGESLNLALATATFPDVRFERLDDVISLKETDRYPPEWAYSSTEWHWWSVCVLRKLLKLEQEGIAFDYVEFPDWGGMGFAATQEKLFSAAFSGTTLAVRLHSSDGVIRSAEPHFADKRKLALYDIERKALRDCDQVIAQLMPIANYNKELYGFSPSEWDPRVIRHAPPVLIDKTECTKSLRIALGSPLLFTSKLQQIKAPDVFVRACVGFMRSCPEYYGQAHLLAHNTDSEFASYVRRLIPADLAHRFRFYDASIPQPLREKAISEGVVVFPSRFESFCLAAYEASMLGAAIVLNESNPAFGNATFWKCGENCVKYSGTVEALVDVLLRIFNDSPELVPISPPLDVVPWQQVAPVIKRLGPKEDGLDEPLVSVVIPNFNLGELLPHTLRSVTESSYPNLEIIVCDDASTDPRTIDILRRLEESRQTHRLRIVYANYNRGLAGARNLAIRETTGKYILTLDADDFVSPDFISKAVGALERNPEYAIVAPQTAYFSGDRNEVPRRQSEYLDFAIFHGEAVACGFLENRFSTATVLARRALFDEIQYREELRALEDWDFYLRSAIAGKRFIVTNELHFFYRSRPGSMISELSDLSQKALRYDELRRIQTLRCGNLQFPAYVASAEQSHGVSGANLAEVARLSAELNALRNSGSVRTALHVANVVKARAPWLVGPAKRLGMKGWGMYNRLRRRKA